MTNMTNGNYDCADKSQKNKYIWKTMFVLLTKQRASGLSGNLNGCCYPNTSSSLSPFGGEEVVQVP